MVHSKNPGRSEAQWSNYLSAQRRIELVSDMLSHVVSVLGRADGVDQIAIVGPEHCVLPRGGRGERPATFTAGAGTHFWRGGASARRAHYALPSTRSCRDFERYGHTAYGL
jgi:hypothetical protein